MKSLSKPFSLLFPGQGCQYVGMCRQLLQKSPLFTSIIDEASSILGINLGKLLQSSDIAELTLSINAQPLVVATSYALYRLFSEKFQNANPSCIVGHSLGEITALIAANAMSFTDGLCYARARGQLMHQAVLQQLGFAAVVVDVDKKKLATVVDDIKVNAPIAISGFNSPKQFTVVGSAVALKSLSKHIDKLGGESIPFKMIPMKADAPFHSELMCGLLPEIEALLQTITFKKPSIGVWSTVSAKKVTSAKNIYKNLRDQLVQPVRWTQTLNSLCDSPVQQLIDLGPNKILYNLVREDKSMPIAFAFDNYIDRV